MTLDVLVIDNARHYVHNVHMAADVATVSARRLNSLP